MIGRSVPHGEDGDAVASSFLEAIRLRNGHSPPDLHALPSIDSQSALRDNGPTVGSSRFLAAIRRSLVCRPHMLPAQRGDWPPPLATQPALLEGTTAMRAVTASKITLAGSSLTRHLTPSSRNASVMETALLRARDMAPAHATEDSRLRLAAGLRHLAHTLSDGAAAAKLSKDDTAWRQWVEFNLEYELNPIITQPPQGPNSSPAAWPSSSCASTCDSAAAAG